MLQLLHGGSPSLARQPTGQKAEADLLLLAVDNAHEEVLHGVDGFPVDLQQYAEGQLIALGDVRRHVVQQHHHLPLHLFLHEEAKLVVAEGAVVTVLQSTAGQHKSGLGGTVLQCSFKIG